MKALSAVVLWVRGHKAGIGALLGFVAGGLEHSGKREAASIVGLAATWLLGAGVHPSDAAVKEFDKPK